MPATGLLPQSARHAIPDDGVARLVEGAARSDAGAWEELVERHGRMVAAIARSHGLPDADIADVTQTVWLRLLEHIDRIRHPERVGGWLATTTRNECMRVWRQRGRVTLLADPGLLDLLVDECDPEPRVETHDRDTQLRAAVATLPTHQQAIIGKLMSDPSPSYVQVAEDLGIPVGSIGPNRQRCLRTLHGKCLSMSIGVS
jgi:RNA polymerase sigma factor (sigma-70 family)